MPIHKVWEMRLSEVPGANGGGWVEIRLQGAYASLLVMFTLFLGPFTIFSSSPSSSDKKACFNIRIDHHWVSLVGGVMPPPTKGPWFPRRLCCSHGKITLHMSLWLRSLH